MIKLIKILIHTESRGKVKRKLRLILPLIILLKLVNLKIMSIIAVSGIGLIQLLLISGGAYLFYYLKNTAHCKIQGYPVHTHSHVVEPESGITLL